MLELKVPSEVLKPIKAMESVFSGFWQMHDPARPREIWFEGHYQVNFSIEIVSSEGQVHFYMRIPQEAQRLVESAIYSQYPETEISVVEDYTKFFPRDIPNKDWEMWGTNFKLEKPDVYPIRTYAMFFEESTAEKEEKRIDPLSLLLEGLAKLGQGEHLWIQILLWPKLPTEDKYVERGTEIVNKLVKRPEKAKASGFAPERKAAYFLATGHMPEEAVAKEEMFPPEARLTPGERDIVAAIEQKISKPAFQASIRCIYLAKQENYFSPTKALPISFFNQMSSTTLNNFRPIKRTYTKEKTIFTWFLDARRLFLRKRRVYRYYTSRLSPFYPWQGSEETEHGKYILNIEELATIFHFPGKMTVPGVAVPRIESKKGEAPSELPTE
ncbi:MAG: hypothetical protein Greene071421_60 [Parcubacteria group bacterium Greene0714_21]|nr:MAG: hypothetical protein Greene041639_458 [Parcubacteria group bacterium Greene0416_39]TSC97833.1 MAG: hypothetical protein Greene101447_284 [Parcubacteria group bacterium Greene1014_47]TSD04574.1 MAG: hypothetical protein Greene071421_60 [Parcubacteria group bacterium Greene0714_21]